MSDFLGDFLSDIGFGGAQTGADIVRMLGVTAPTEKPYGAGLDPLFATVRGGLAELPGLLATLTGQAQTAAGVGRERITGGFQVGRAGLEQRGIELGRAGQVARARGGFAGAGALGRRERLGRRQLGQQFMGILGARRTGLAGVEAGLEESLFGAEQRVERERAGLLGTVGTGIQNLLNALISGGVKFGAGGNDEPPIDPSAYSAWQNYRDRGGTLPYQEWMDEGSPAAPTGITVEGDTAKIGGYGGKDQDYADWRDYRAGGGTLGYQEWLSFAGRGF